MPGSILSAIAKKKKSLCWFIKQRPPYPPWPPPSPTLCTHSSNVKTPKRPQDLQIKAERVHNVYLFAVRKKGSFVKNTTPPDFSGKSSHFSKNVVATQETQQGSCSFFSLYSTSVSWSLMKERDTKCFIYILERERERDGVCFFFVCGVI